MLRDHLGEWSIRGLTLPALPWDDIKDWKNLPAGSVLYIDEAQKWFPARRTGDPPAWMREMSELRHYGIRFVLATQKPIYLDTYVRGLAGPHEHMVRVNGQEGATIYRHQKLIPDVDSEKSLVAHDSEFWPFPKEHYEHYRSAEVHTVKRTFSSKSKRRVKILAAAAGLFACVMLFLFRDQGAADQGGKEASEGGSPLAATAPLAPASGQAGPKSYRSAAEYLLDRAPLLDTIPSSAPIFHARQVVAEPAIYCMSSEAGRDANGKWKAGSCTCHTEQGTVWPVEDVSCRYIARNGTPYDPYKRPAAPGAGPAPAAPVTASVAAGVAQNTPGVVGVSVAAPAGVGNGLTVASDVASIGGVK